MSMEHSHEHFSQGASCCAGGCCSGSCCGSGDAIRPVPAVLGIALFVAALVMGSDSWSGMAAYAAAYLLIGWDVLKAAFLGLRHGRAMDENFLMSIASLGAMFLGDYSEAVGVMLFYRVGEYLQERAVGSSRRSVSELMNLRPESVHVREGGTVRDVPPAEVRPGSVIEVRPGERVPLDGTVTEGNSVLDTSAMTGESLPVEAGAGSTVLAGYINGQGVLEVRTDRDWRHSALARVQELVEAASGHKSPLEGRLSTFSRIYTPLVISIAVLVFLLYPFVTGGSWTDGLFRALVLLVIYAFATGIITYNSSRIDIWLDPFNEEWMRDKGYQIRQSLLSIGSGGLFGLGLGKSRQKFLFLPEEHNDFIFAIICEELGLVGATIIMVMFALLIIRGYWIALHARDRFCLLYTSPSPRDTR